MVATGMEAEAARELQHGRPRPQQGHGDLRRRPADRDRRATSTTSASSSGLNERTCLNQKPIVRVGRARSRRARSSPTAPAPTRASWPWAATCWSAFMAWDGYNFEDAIIISEELVAGRRLHLDPHRGVRDRDPRDEAGPRGVHPRHPQRLREGAAEPGRERHRPGGHVRRARATSWSARSRRSRRAS